MSGLSSLKKNAVETFISSYLIQFASKFISIITQLIIARFFLSTEEFGIFLYVFFIFSIINNLRDLGISTQVIRQKDIDYSLINSLFFVLSSAITLLQIIYGCFIYKTNPSYSKALIFMSLSYVPTALGSVPSIYFAQNLLIKKTLNARISSMIAYFFGAIMLTYAGLGASGLALAKFLQSAVFTILIRIKASDIIKTNFKLSGTRNIVKESYKFFINDNLGLLTTEIYNYVIKNFVSTASLAIYRAAYSLVDIPVNIIEQAFYKVAYPMFSKLSSDKEKLLNAYSFLTIILFCVEVPVYLYIFFNSELLIYFTYGSKYSTSSEMIKWLAFVPIFTPYTTFGIELFKSLKKDNWLLTYIFIGSFLIILFSFILTANYGIKGTAAANYLGLNYFIIYYFIYKNFKKHFYYILKKMAVIYLFPASLFYITSNTEFKFGFLKSSVIFFANSVKPLSETLYRKISDLNLKLEIISQGLYHLIFLVLIFYIFYIFIYKKMQKELGIKL
ncbi:oligosaccharide flippase family protein [Candidatus Dependentiae bacterium]|nr:oligosaccharide flippase family protein [Candidatus Dependentiae bacterium]